MFTSSWGPGHTGSLHSQRAITGWRMPFPPKAPVCVPPWQTQPESRDARGAMDSRGLVWSQQQKIPRFQAVGRYTTATYHRPTVTAFDREKRKKNQTFSKPQNNCGMFFRTSFCTVQQRHITLRVYLKVRSYYYQPTDRGKSKPHTQNPRDLHVKNERLTSRLYHHPGCFPLDTFQLVNVQKTWLPNGLICTEDLLPVLILPWLFRVKLFSLNVK